MASDLPSFASNVSTSTAGAVLNRGGSHPPVLPPQPPCLPLLAKGCRHAKGAPETLPVGETGVARARTERPEGDRPTCTSLDP